MLRKRVLQLLGILIFIIILRKLNLDLVLSLLSNVDPVILLIALFIKLPFLFVKCYRWQYLLRIQGIDYDLRNSILAYLGSMYMGLVTPGRIGDFAKVFHLKKDKNISFSKGFSSVFADRMFDLLILVSIACVGGLALALSWNILLVIFAFFLLFLAVIFLFMNEIIGKKVVSILFSMFLPRRAKEHAEIRFSSFYAGIEQLKNSRIIYPLFLSLFSYLLFFIQSYLIARSLNIPISFLNVTFSISTANLVSLLPVSVAGIGTRDATLISMFSVLNLSKESALAFSIMFLFISNVSSCLIGAVAWFKKPVDVRV